MIKKFWRLLFLCGLFLLLTACTFSHYHRMAATSLPETSKSTSYIAKKKLADGTVVKLGMLKPKPDWNCVTIATQTYSWLQLRREALFKNPNRGYGPLWSKAIEYANANHLKTNYIYYRIPLVIPLFSTNNASGYPDDTTVIFYQCQKNTL